MFGIRGFAQPARRVCLGLMLTLGIVAFPASPAHVLAHSRAADATAPAAVAYHLSVLYSGGSAAGTAIDGKVVGSIDSTGTLTATLTTTTALTATVTGSVKTSTSATPSVSLTLQGPAATYSLSRSSVSVKHGLFAGQTMQASQATGSFALSLEGTATTYQFAGTVSAGRHKGATLSGVLATVTDAWGRFDGTLTLDDGTAYIAYGHVTGANLLVQIKVPHCGTIEGVAPHTVQIVYGTAYTLFGGTFIGPGGPDSGKWTASPTS